MSDEAPRPDARYNGTAIGYLAIGLISCVVMLLTLNTRAAGPWTPIAPFVGAIGLVLRWQSAPVFVLLSAAIAVMVTKESEFSRPEFDDILLAFSLVSYSLALSRLVGLAKSIWPADPRPAMQPRIDLSTPKSGWRHMLLNLTVVYPIWNMLSRTADPEGESRRLTRASADELGVALLFPAIALAAAFAMWRVVTSLPVPLRVDEAQWPVGVVVWILITAAIMVKVIIGVIAARRMSQQQALLVLNDVVWSEHRRELHRVARMTAKKAPRRNIQKTEVPR